MVERNELFLIGHPIGHSKSPVMYNDLYTRMGLAWRYELNDLATDQEADEFISSRTYLSLNITTPYKPNALASADVVAASARLANGANLLVNHKDKLLAYNTDGEGCISYLEREGFRFRESSVVICGTGPTALAILHAAGLAGPREIVMLSRRKGHAKAVLRSYVDTCEELLQSSFGIPAVHEGHLSMREAYDHVALKFGSYETSTEAIRNADIVINATPLGMKKGDPAPFDPSLFREGQQVFDVVYGHGSTAFFQGAQAAGCKPLDGSGMLVSQAVSTVEILCNLKGIDLTFSWDEMFNLMAKAAGFSVRV